MLLKRLVGAFRYYQNGAFCLTLTRKGHWRWREHAQLHTVLLYSCWFYSYWFPSPLEKGMLRMDLTVEESNAYSGPRLGMGEAMEAGWGFRMDPSKTIDQDSKSWCCSWLLHDCYEWLKFAVAVGLLWLPRSSDSTLYLIITIQYQMTGTSRSREKVILSDYRCTLIYDQQLGIPWDTVHTLSGYIRISAQEQDGLGNQNGPWAVEPNCWHWAYLIIAPGRFATRQAYLFLPSAMWVASSVLCEILGRCASRSLSTVTKSSKGRSETLDSKEACEGHLRITVSTAMPVRYDISMLGWFMYSYTTHSTPYSCAIASLTYTSSSWVLLTCWEAKGTAEQLALVADLWPGPNFRRFHSIPIHLFPFSDAPSRLLCVPSFLGFPDRQANGGCKDAGSPVPHTIFHRISPPPPPPPENLGYCHTYCTLRRVAKIPGICFWSGELCCSDNIVVALNINVEGERLSRKVYKLLHLELGRLSCHCLPDRRTASWLSFSTKLHTSIVSFLYQVLPSNNPSGATTFESLSELGSLLCWYLEQPTTTPATSIIPFLFTIVLITIPYKIEGSSQNDARWSISLPARSLYNHRESLFDIIFSRMHLHCHHLPKL